MPDQNTVEDKFISPSQEPTFVPKKDQGEIENIFNSSNIGNLSSRDSLGNIQEFDTNIIPEAGFEALRLQQAREQSTKDQIANATVQTLGGIALGIGENLGYLLELPAAIASDKKDYSNALVETMKSQRQDLREMFPIRRENPEEVIDFTDAAWWIENGQGLVESIGEFAVTGGGVGGGLAKATQLAKLTGSAGKAASALSQGLTASSLAYTEGAMSASEIYKQVYNKHLLQNPNDTEGANRLASDAASKTVKINTLINTGLNMTGIAPIFAKSGILNSAFKIGKESRKEYIQRITKEAAKLTQDNPKLKDGLLREVLQEGIEEEVNLIAEQEGKLEGGLVTEDQVGKTLSDRIKTAVFSDEGKLSFALGAIGGSGQQLVMNAIGSKNREQAAKDDYINRKFQLDNILKTSKEIDSSLEELNIAVQNSEFDKAEEIKQRIFNPLLSYHTKRGSSEALKGSFKEIQELDNREDLGQQLIPQINEISNLVQQRIQEGASQEEVNQLVEQRNEIIRESNRLTGVTEAMEKGFAENPNDNSYVEKARKKVQQIENAERQYISLLEKYGANYEEGAPVIPNLLLDNKLLLDSINEEEIIINSKKTDLDTSISNVIPENFQRRSFILENENNALEELKESYSMSSELTDSEKQLLFNTLDKKRIKELSENRIERINEEIQSNNNKIQLNNETIKNEEINEKPISPIIDSVVPSIINNSKSYYNNLFLKEEVQKEIFDLENNKLRVEEEQQKIEDQVKKEEKEYNKKKEEDLKEERIKQRKKESEIKPQQQENRPKEVVQSSDQDENFSLLDSLFEDSPQQLEPKQQEIEKVKQGDGALVKIAENRFVANNFTDSYNETNSFSNNNFVVYSKPDNKYDPDRKIINAGNTIANLTKEFNIVEGKIQTKSNELNPNYPVVLMTGLVKQGDNVTLSYDIKVEEDGVNLSKLWKNDIYNKPIKVEREGEVIGYIHTLNWINENNVADPDGKNIEKQRKLLKALREQISSEGSISTKISSVSGETALSKNVEKGLSSLNDTIPNAELGIVDLDGISDNNKKITTNNTDDFIQNYQGKAVAILPYSNKNEKLAVPILRNRINNSDTEHIVEVLENYILRNNKNLLDSGKDLIGKNLNKLDDVKDYLSNFIFIHSYNDNKIEELKLRKADGSRYLFLKKGQIAIQQPGFEEDIITPENFSSNKELLIEHINDTFYNVDKSKLNSNTKILLPYSDETYILENVSYNTLTKSRTKTDVLENNFTYKGKEYRSYFDNPTFEIQYPFNISDILNPKKEEKIEVPKSQLGKDILAGLIEDNENFLLVKPKDKNKKNRSLDFAGFSSEQNDKFDLLNKQLSPSIDLPINIVNDIVNTLQFRILGLVNSGNNSPLVTVKQEIESIYRSSKGHPRERIYKNILDNFSSYIKQVNLNLSKLGVNTTEDLEINGLEDIESNFEKLRYNDDWNLSQDSKHNSSTRLKRFFSSIENTDENGDLRMSLIGPTYIPVDIVFNKLKQILANTPPSYKDMIQRLEEVEDSIPWISNVIDILNPIEPDGNFDLQQIRNEFVQVMSNFRYTFKSVLFKNSGNKYSNRVISSDQSANFRLILNEWRENLKNTNLVKIENNDQIINKEEVDKLKQELKKFKEQKISSSDPKYKEFFVDYLNRIGVKLSNASIEKIFSKNADNISPATLFSDKGIIGILNSRFSDTSGNTNEEFERSNPLFNNTAINRLAILEAEFTDSIQSNSHLNLQGNNISAINQNREFTRRYRELTENEGYTNQLSNLPFQKSDQKTWLNQFRDKNEKFLKDFDVELLDGINEEGNSSSASSPNGMTPKELEVTKLISYENNNIKDVGRFVHLVPSKNTTFMFKAPKIKLGLDSNNNLNDETLDVLYSIVKSEIDRINTNIDQYGKAGKQFYFFSNLNNFPDLITDGQIIETQEVKDNIKNHIKEEFQKSLDDKIKVWKKLNIITSDNKINYINNQPSSVDNFVGEYILNQMWFQYNLFQSFVGDPAQFGKRTVNSTWDNIFKRLTKDQAPGIDIPSDPENPTYLQVLLEDREVQSDYLDSIPKEYRKAYEKIPSTDAQEYTTAQEHLHLLKQLGKISTKQYKDVLSKINNNIKLTNSEQGLFQPMKPVYTGKNVLKDQDGNPIAETTVYVKSSSFPLLPQWTEGTELDNLRKALEELQGRRGMFVRAAYQTATKLGQVKEPLSIFDDDGNIDENLSIHYTQEGDILNNAVELKREGFRIQQEVPYKKIAKVVDGSQQRKLIQLALGLNNTGDFIINGEKLSSKEVKEKYNKIYNNEYFSSINKIKEELNDENGNLDISKLQKSLVKEAEERGWSKTDIDSLKLENNSFSIPLWFNNSRERIESLLQSLVNNAVIKRKRTGGSFVLASEEGFKGFSTDIIYSEEYDGELKPSRIEDGKVKPAQILLPNKFAKKIPTINKEGRKVIDFSKMPKDLLSTFGYRIPTQGYNSMSQMEIVGFLPSYMGDMVVVPKEFTVQMGSDFDVDKLNIFFYDLTESEGKLSKVNNSNNNILDLSIGILQNKKVNEYVVEPLDTDTLKNLANNLKKSSNLPRIYDGYFNDKFQESRDGAAGIGVFATLSTYLSLVADENSQNPVKFERDIFFNDLKGNNIDNPYTLDNRLKISVASQFLSASVDNEKEPILGAINANTNTFGAIQVMISTGFNEEQIVKFISQPVIKRYNEIVQEIIESKDFNGQNIKLQAFNKIQEELGSPKYIPKPKFKDVGSKDSAIQISQLQQYMNFTEAGKVLRKIKDNINTDSSGLPKDIISSKLKEDSINELINLPILNAEKILGDFNIENNGDYTITPTSIYGFATVHGLMENNRIWEQLQFPYFNRFFDIIKEHVQVNQERNLEPKDLNEIFKEYKNYIYSGALERAGIIDQDLAQERIRLMQGSNSLARRIEELKSNTNNLFIKSLFIKKDKKTGTDIVGFNNTAQIGIDESYLYQSFNELFEDNTRDIAEDLIKYAYLNNSNPSVNSFVRFIPPQYLEVTGISEQLKNANTDTDNTEEFLNQFYRNNPRYARKVDISNVSILQSSNNLPLVFVGDITDKNSKEVADFKSYFDKDQKQWRLYKHEGNGVYSIVNTLGDQKNIKEYYPENSNTKSVYARNNVIINSTSPRITRQIDNSNTENVLNAESFPSYINNYNFNSFDTLINSIKNNEKVSDNYKLILDLLSKSGFNKPTITLTTDKSIFAAYDQENNEVIIRPSNNENVFIHNLVHELIHSATTSSVLNPKNKEQRSYLNQIDGIRKNYYKQLRSENEEVTKSFDSKLRLLQGTREQRLKFVQDGGFEGRERQLYESYNLQEFIVGLFTSNQLQSELNNKKFTGEKTLFERFIEVINNFLNNFTVDNKKIDFTSELNVAIKNSIGLINSASLQEIENSQIPIKEESKDIDFSGFERNNDEKYIKDKITNQKVEYKIVNSSGNFITYPLSNYNDVKNRISEINRTIGNESKAVIKQKGNLYYIDIIPTLTNKQETRKKTRESNIINELQNDLRFINNRISEDKENRPKLIEKRDKLQEQIDTLLEDNSLGEIQEIGVEQISQVESLLSNARLSEVDLVNSIRTLSLWSQASNYVLDGERISEEKYRNSKAVKEVLDLQSRANALIKDVWLGKSREFIKQAGNDVGIDGDIKQIFGFKEGIGLGVESDNSVFNNFLDISRTDSPLLTIVDTLIRNSTTLAEKELVEKAREIDKVFSEFKNTNFFKEYGFDIFQQKIGDKRTGYLVNRTSQEYFDKQSELRNNIDSLVANNAPKEIKNAAQKAYFKFLNDNNIFVDVRELYTENEDGSITSKNSINEKTRLSKELGEQRAKDALTLTEKRIKSYEKDLKAKIEQLSVDFEEDFAAQQTALKEWKLANSPFDYLDIKEGKKSNLINRGTGNAKFIRSRGYNYTYSTPIKKWHDPEFDIINNNVEASEFYNWFKSELREFFRLAPDTIFQELQYNYLPSIPMSLLDEISDKGLFKANIGKRFLDLLRDKGLDKNTLSIDRVSGRPEYHLEFPFREINKLETEGEKQRRIDNSITDLQDILKIVAKSSLLYKHKKEVEDKVKLGQTLLDYQREIINRNNNTEFGQDKVESKEKNALIHKKEQLDYAITSGLYEENPPTKANVYINKRFLDSNDKKTLEELKELLKKTDDPKLAEKIQVKMNKLGAPVSSRKGLRLLLNYTQLRGMGYNILSSITNLNYAWAGNYIHAAGGDDFTVPQFQKAFQRMLSTTKNILPGIGIGAAVGSFILPGFGTIIGAGFGGLITGDRAMSKESQKISNLMKLFNAMGDIIDVNDFKKDFYKGERKWYERFTPYELQRKSEYFSYGTTLLALLENEKVQTNKGEVSLYSIFDEKGEVKKDIEVLSGWNGEQDFLKFKNKLDGVNKSIHGNYDKKSPILIKKDTLGQAVMQFRSWLPEGIANRFEDEKFDYNLNRVREGRYRLFLGKDWKRNTKKLLRRIAFLDRNAVYNDLKEHEVANLRRAAAEMQILVSLTALALTLKFMDDEDDDKDNLRGYLGNFALNNLFRLQDDLMFYVSPTSSVQLSRSLIPAFKVITDTNRVLDYSYKVLFDEDIDDRTYDAWINNTVRLFPAGSSITNAIKSQEQIANKSFR